MKYILIALLFVGLFTSCKDGVEKRDTKDITYDEIILNKAYGADSVNHYAIRIGGENDNKVYIFKPDDGITVYKVKHMSGVDALLVVGLSMFLGGLFMFMIMALYLSNK